MNAKDITFETGYVVFFFNEPHHVKLFFYPEDDRLRITTIPTDRKYNITGDVNIAVPNFGYYFLKHQPQNSNSELMIQIPETHLTMNNIDDAVLAIVTSTRDIFSKFEKQSK